ncbi:MAG: hypothetical protein Ct9H300mP11_03340 [Chloroflexota bacterium]|nr:MAG: hypothetical protein Ct9H300mP11_03340 [Chloroflexota bacterium]
MRWILEVAYIGATTSWKGAARFGSRCRGFNRPSFGIGVIGGDEVEGGLNEPSESASITPTPADNPTTKSEESISNSSTVQLARFISVPQNWLLGGEYRQPGIRARLRQDKSGINRS